MNSETSELSILIVGYNSLDYLDQCISAIAPAVTQYSYEILFVNNGTDGSEELLQTRHSAVRVLKSRGNVGFSAANNYLANHAQGRWLLLLNPDTRLYPGAVDVLLNVGNQNPHYEVLGGVTVSQDGTPEASARVVLPSLTSIIRGLLGHGGPTLAVNPRDRVVEVDALSGGFMMVRHDCWFDLGGLDETFFLYAEELDFFMRLKKRGGRVGQVIDSRMYHDVGSGETYSPARVRFRATGNAHYLHKHFSPPYAYSCILLLWLKMLVRHWGGRLLAAKNERYQRMSLGFADVACTPWTWMGGYSSAGADPRKRG